MADQLNPFGTVVSNINTATSVSLNIEFPSYSNAVVYPSFDKVRCCTLCMILMVSWLGIIIGNSMGTFALEGGVTLAYSPPKNYTITKLSVCLFWIHSNHSNHSKKVETWKVETWKVVKETVNSSSWVRCLCCTGALKHFLWGWLERRCWCWRAISWLSAKGNYLFENWSLWVHISCEEKPCEWIHEFRVEVATARVRGETAPPRG